MHAQGCSCARTRLAWSLIAASVRGLPGLGPCPSPDIFAFLPLQAEYTASLLGRGCGRDTPLPAHGKMWQVLHLARKRRCLLVLQTCLGPPIHARKRMQGARSRARRGVHTGGDMHSQRVPSETTADSRSRSGRVSVKRGRGPFTPGPAPEAPLRGLLQVSWLPASAPRCVAGCTGWESVPRTDRSWWANASAALSSQGDNSAMRPQDLPENPQGACAPAAQSCSPPITAPFILLPFSSRPRVTSPLPQ